MDNHDDLLQQVESLAETFLALSGRLTQVIKELQDPGIPPSEELIEQQLAAYRAFIHIRDAILEYTKSMGVVPISETNQTTTVQSLKAFLIEAKAAEEKRKETEEVRQHALEIVATILRIVHRDTSEFPPLRQCYARADELRSLIEEASWTEIPPEVQALAKGTHPLSALLTFIKHFEEFDDKQWESFYATIAESFEQDLVTAVLRRKLVLQPDASLQESTISSAPYEEYSDFICTSEPSGEAEAKLPLNVLTQGGRAEESETSLINLEETQTSNERISQDFLTEGLRDVAEASISATETPSDHFSTGHFAKPF
jgi:hypothetical protein